MVENLFCAKMLKNPKADDHGFVLPIQVFAKHFLNPTCVCKPI